MSEEAKPVCIHCALPIHGTAYGGDGEWRHFNTSICGVAQIREIDALRAALDQERARLDVLDSPTVIVSHDVRDGYWYIWEQRGSLNDSDRKRIGQGETIREALDAALLSGRGDGSETK